MLHLSVLDLDKCYQYIGNPQSLLTYRDLISYKFDMDYLKNTFKRKHLVGELFLKSQIKKLLDLDLEKIIIKRDRPKPYLMDFQLFFSLSYSNNFIACAISNEEIGIDIEKVDIIPDLNILINFVCSDYEKNIIFNYDTQLGKNREFLRVWSAKESVLKYCGIGLIENLRMVNVYNDTVNFNSNSYDLYTSLYEGEYWISVCQDKIKDQFSVESISSLEV